MEIRSNISEKIQLATFATTSVLYTNLMTFPRGKKKVAKVASSLKSIKNKMKPAQNSQIRSNISETYPQNVYTNDIFTKLSTQGGLK